MEGGANNMQNTHTSPVAPTSIGKLRLFLGGGGVVQAIHSFEGSSLTMYVFLGGSCLNGIYSLGEMGGGGSKQIIFIKK